MKSGGGSNDPGGLVWMDDPDDPEIDPLLNIFRVVQARNSGF